VGGIEKNLLWRAVVKKYSGIFMMQGAALILCVLLSGTDNSSAASRGLNVVSIKDSAGKQVGLYRESHALVIGVSEYDHWPLLPGVMKDIEIVKQTFESLGFNVEVVKNPVRTDMVSAIESFINRYGHGVDNRLIIYFAGHGHTLKLAYGGEMGYIVPKDAPNPNRDKPGFLGKAMDMQQMEVYARRIQAKHALFLFDSCFSGSLFSLSRAIPEHISYKTSRPVRQFITAGGADEKVPDESIFRRQLVAGLNGEADQDKDGYVTGMELGEFLQKKVINYSKGSQHPQYGTLRDPNLDKGDFVFVLKNIPQVDRSLTQLDLEEKELERQKRELAEDRLKLEKEKELALKKRGLEEERKKLEREKELFRKEQGTQTARLEPSSAGGNKHRRLPSHLHEFRIEPVLRTAKFGSTEAQVRRFIVKQLGVPDAQIRHEAQTKPWARILSVHLTKIMPKTGAVKILWVFTSRQKKLAAMEIVWPETHGKTDALSLLETGELFKGYLVKRGHFKESQVKTFRKGDGSVVFFRTRDKKGRMVMLSLSPEHEKNRKLTLTYKDPSTIFSQRKHQAKTFRGTRR